MDSLTLLAVETSDKKGHPILCNLERFRFGDMEMAVCCKVVSHHLPCFNIFRIVAGWKLGNP